MPDRGLYPNQGSSVREHFLAHPERGVGFWNRGSSRYTLDDGDPPPPSVISLTSITDRTYNETDVLDTP